MWSITIAVIVFIITIILAMIETKSFPYGFFWITIFCVIVLNSELIIDLRNIIFSTNFIIILYWVIFLISISVANGVYQNTVFGMAAKLPGKYTGAVVLGSNISGTFASVVSLLSTMMTSNIKMAAIYYFITALFVLLVCFDTYFALPLNVSEFFINLPAKFHFRKTAIISWCIQGSMIHWECR